MKNGLEGLDAFQVALQLAEEVHALGLRGSIRDQLTRSSESVVLNIAEAHPATGQDRIRGFVVARKEASECRGALAILRVRKQIKPETYDRLWNLVDRISAMLYRLIHPG